MDILDDINGVNEKVDLDTMFPQDPVVQSNPLPKGAIRNRASSTALLASDASQAVDNYRVIVDEASQGQDTTQKSLMSQVEQANEKLNTETMMKMLADPKLSMEQKQAIIKNAKTSVFMNDTLTNLHTGYLMKGSEGEHPDNEDARISTADAIREIYQARNEMQGLVNAHGASLPDAGIGTVAGMAESWVVPFGNNLIQGRIGKELAEKQGETSLWKRLKGFFLPGTNISDTREALERIPPEKRAEFTKSILDTISNNAGIILPQSNHFAQYEKARAILEQGGYSSTDEFLDNVSSLLDIVGVGQFVRGVRRGAKGASEAEKLAGAETRAVSPSVPVSPKEVGFDVAQAPSVATRTQQPVAQMPVPPTAQGPSAQKAIEDAVAQRAELLSQINPAERGDIANVRKELENLKAPVSDQEALSARTKEIQKNNKLSFKEAQAQAIKEAADKVADYEATRNRLQNIIDINSRSAKAEQQLAELDKKIENLQKIPRGPSFEFNPLVDAMNRIEFNSFARRHNPASPAGIAQQANPTVARGFHEAVVNSVDDASAEALYGTSRVDAIADDILPQGETVSGAVITKTADIDRSLRNAMNVSDEIKSQATKGVSIHYSAAERRKAQANVYRDFSSAEGLSMNDSMSSFKSEGGRIKINAVYGLPEGSFSSAKQAYDQAQSALRHWGLRPDEIEILQKKGLDHVPVNIEDVKDIPGNYLVRIKTDHEIDPTDIGKAFDKLDVLKNFFDRVPYFVSNRKGSVSRYLTDAASMLHPTITGAAAVAQGVTAKFDKMLLDVAAQFSDRFVKMDKARQAKMHEYILEANFNGIAFDRAALTGRGFSGDEIETLSKWRDFWDAHYYLENYDIVRTLNANGYQLFQAPGTDLIARPIAKNQNITRVYDPNTDSVITLSKQDGDQLYDFGGTLAKLRRPTTFGQDTVEHMIVRNTPTQYMRRIRDTDQVLNYREGYFQIQYTAPRFVDEVVRNSNGIVTERRAVAVAGDTQEAQRFADRMNGQQNGKEYIIREDNRPIARDSNDYWDLASSSGRIAQRHRGKLLEDSTGLNHLGDGSYILNPVDSAVRAARSIGGRTIMRPMLESAKARAIAQYADVLPSNGMGGKRWPGSVDEIAQEGGRYSGQARDARSTFEYINYLENGYINTIDEAWKQTFNAAADLIGRKTKLTKLERAALKTAEVQSVTGAGKGAVFFSLIASNPLRQFVVQSHQAVRTYGYNPVGWMTGGVQKLVTGFGLVKSGAFKNLPKDIKDFAAFIDETGLLAGVDKHNLVRGTLLEAAGRSNKATRLVGAPVDVVRKVGFDAGEQANLLAHSAAVWDRYKRLKKDLSDPVVRQEAHSEISALSYDMNFAGDMPYNQTTPSLIMQFMQVPHKAFLQAFNRRLDVPTRMRMVATDILFWGTPAAFLGNVLGSDILPEDPELREKILWGIESWAFNKLLSDIAGEDVNIDWSSMAPYEMTGWSEFVKNVMGEGLSTVLINSPAGQLFLKEGGRMENAVRSIGRYFSAFIDDDEDHQTVLEVANEVAKISSGWNNAWKAKLMFDTGKAMDKTGQVVDGNVHKYEAIAQVFGMAPASLREYYYASKQFREDSKDYEEEVLRAYRDIKQYTFNQLQTPSSDPEFYTKVTGRLMKTFEDSPRAMQIIYKQLLLDMQGPDSKMVGLILRRAGIPDQENVRDEIRRSTMTEEQKKNALDLMDAIRDYRYQNEE